MKITTKINDIDITQDVNIITFSREHGLVPWTDEEITSLAIDPAAKAFDGCIVDDLELRLARAGWTIVPGSYESVGRRHTCEARHAPIPLELAQRVNQPYHLITAAESKRLGAPWCSPMGRSRAGWWYYDAEGIPQHAGPAEIGEEGCKRAAEAALSTREFKL